MPTGSKNLKRRRPTVSMKTHMRKKLDFKNRDVRQKWDLHRTLKQNYSTMGLTIDLNSHNQIYDLHKKEEVPVEFAGAHAMLGSLGCEMCCSLGNSGFRSCVWWRAVCRRFCRRQ